MCIEALCVIPKPRALSHVKDGHPGYGEAREHDDVHSSDDHQLAFLGRAPQLLVYVQGKDRTGAVEKRRDGRHQRRENGGKHDATKTCEH